MIIPFPRKYRKTAGRATSDINCCQWVESLLPPDADQVRGAASGEDAAPSAQPVPEAVARFFSELKCSLPREYSFREESRIIFEKGEPPSAICGPIRVASTLRRTDGSGWAIEVEYLDADDRLKRATISKIELNSGRGPAFMHLLDTGLAIHSGIPAVAALLRAWPSAEHSWRTDAAGWFQDPDGVISFVEADGRVHQPPGAPVVHAAATDPRPMAAGSLQGWQDEVAALSAGNPALVFAISAALAGPLLRWSGFETAGFNVFGPSAVGKSLMLHLARSCTSAPESVTPWGAAQTGLHRFSAEAQDGLLVLDAFPRDPDARHLKALLALGDDAGAGRIVSHRDPDGGRRWRRVLLSSSELPLSACLLKKKRDVPAALAARIIDIPADHAAHGIISEAHGEDAVSFVRRLEAAMRRQNGHLLSSWLERVVADLPGFRRDLTDRLPVLAREVQDHCRAEAPASPGQRPAVAERFALVGYAGELAIGFGLLPWAEGSARQAALAMARIAHPPPEPTDLVGIPGSLNLVRAYVARHAARIMDLDPEHPLEITPDAIGWRDDDHLYLRKQPVEEEFDDTDSIWGELRDRDILAPGGEQRSLQYKMPDRKVLGRPRCYRLHRGRIEDDEPG